MYNSVTEHKITSAPELEGLDLSRLATMLADAFARITSLKVSLSEDASQKELEELLEELIRIATTYESLYLSGSLRGEQTGQAGFVAATAYSLHCQYSGLPDGKLFSSGGIAPLVSSVLLFISSGYYADAYEMAKRYPLMDDASYLDQTIGEMILALAQFRFPLNLENIDSTQFSEKEDYAVACLYFQCCSAVQLAAESLLSGDQGGVANCASMLNQVKELCFYEFEYNDVAAMSIYPGPLQFAKLLEASVRTMSEGSIFNVQAPAPLEAAQWFDFIRGFAPSRPVLWKQHLSIIEGGFLNIGTSSVLSLPTGAGKTSLAELKIAGCLIGDKKVIFIAPTHALEAQVQERMLEIFGNDVRHVTGDFSEDDQLGKITVCTPEACLTLLSLSPDAFSEVGLFIFDECHILTAPDIEHAKRALDSMFCLLEAFEIQPDADYLLMSAMVENVEELAAWIADITGRPALHFRDEWKPTRQMRGCVVYQKTELDALRELISSTRRRVTNRTPPVALQRELRVTPLSLFCLKNSWTDVRSDYSLLPILDEKVLLTANPNWRLSANRNAVAASIGGRFSDMKVKTLIFCTEISGTASVTKKISANHDASIILNTHEQAIYEQLLIEFGSDNELYFSAESIAGVHHGLLFKEERELVESLFKRSDSGVDVLAATPTLAQGLNLPAEVIILAGDNRFDANADNPAQRQPLEAHEILNAAGRAGRAGHFAQGIVIIIPGEPIQFNEDDGGITNRWIELRENVFSKTDQCVAVVDPLSFIFDAIEAGDTESENVRYALQRLHPSSDSHPMFRRKVSKSFWKHSQVATERDAAFDDLLEAVSGLDFPNADVSEELLKLSEKTGVSTGWLQSVILRLIEHRTLVDELSEVEWLDWICWLPLFTELLKAETVEDMRTCFELAAEDELVPNILLLLGAWMVGNPILNIEALFPENARRRPKCRRSRKAINKWFPDVAYVVGIVRSLYKTAFDEEPPLALQVLQRCIRLGVDSSEKLAFLHINNYTLMRVIAHQEYSAVSDYVGNVDGASFSEIVVRVRNSIHMHEAFGGLDDFE